MRLARSMENDDDVLAAAYAACKREEADAQETYGAYLKEIGMTLSPEELVKIFAAGRAETRPRLMGCIAEARSRDAGNPAKPC